MDITSIRYINLKKNWHRRLMIHFALRRLPYELIRVPGIQYQQGNRHFDKYLSKSTEAYLESSNRTKGVIGCWMAHSVALEDVSEKEGITVILEDDFRCAPNFFQVALRMVNNFNRDFDAILFDTWGTGPLPEHKIADGIFKPKNCSSPFYGGSHCVFVNNRSIQKILNLKLNTQVKDYDGFLLANREVNSFVFYTGLCETRSIGSDISYASNPVAGELVWWVKRKFQKKRAVQE